MNSNTIGTQAPNTVTSAAGVSADTSVPAFLEGLPLPETAAAAALHYEPAVRAAIEELRHAFAGDPIGEGADFAAVMMKHYRHERSECECERRAAEERKSSLTMARAAVAALHVPAVVEAMSDAGVEPTTSYRAPRIAFRRVRMPENPQLIHEANEERGRRGLPDNWLVEKCQLTGEKFAVPIGGPYPVLEVEAVSTATGKRIQGENASPPDLEPFTFTVHPRLVLEGPGAVVAALWGFVDRKVFAAAEALMEAQEMLSGAAGLSADELAGASWPYATVSEWERAGEHGPWKRTPAGWREV
jgi:hypothetical protein